MKNAIQAAIAANLAALSERLSEAAAMAKEAQQAMEQDNQRLAIGTVLDFEKRLPEAQALFAAAMALHRSSN